MKTAEEIHDIIQNLQPTDVYTLAGCVLEILAMQERLAKGLLEIDNAGGEGGLSCVSIGTRNHLENFLDR